LAHLSEELVLRYAEQVLEFRQGLSVWGSPLFLGAVALLLAQPLAHRIKQYRHL